MTLAKYKQKRNFKATPEPKGKVKNKSGHLKFVIQKHAATRLHYDFRLEMEGVLKSWAVPKGPSLNPADKRLAMMVEDHPFDYRTFRGIIPEGNYGAGVVEIFDEGTYSSKNPGANEEKELLKELKEGNLKFVLHGKILNGEFALVRLKDPERENQWLLIKKDDEFAIHKSFDANSIGPLKPFKTKKAATKKTAVKKSVAKKSVTGKKKALKDLNELLHPMLAKANELPDPEVSYSFENKWDGYRCMAKIVGGKVELISRNGLNMNQKFPSIAKELAKIKEDVILDGEVVAFNKENLAEFQLIQNYQDKNITIKYYLFDILFLNGITTIDLLFPERRELLDLLFNKYSFRLIHISKILNGKWEALLKKARQNKSEGIIAKRNNSPYLPGQRTSSWIKLKVENNQSVIICGFTEPRGSRSKFGSLILGVYQGSELKYAGHCGSGFNEKTLEDLYLKMKKLISDKCPFKKYPQVNQPATWLKPKLICEVKFTEWTRDGSLRHPVYKGLREDLELKNIVREPVMLSSNGSKNK